MSDMPRNFDLASFKRANSGMIATNDNSYKGKWERRIGTKLKDYSLEEVEKIINSGSLSEQQKLSRNYYYKDGFYKRLVLHYATLLKYVGLLIPNQSFGKDLSTSHIQKRYFNAVDFVDRINLPIILTNCAQRALVDGCYYGIIQDVKFVRGCPGNTKGVALLCKGRSVTEVIELLSGVTCGPRPTSCPDQLAKALKETL